MAAGVFIGSSTALALSAYSAAADSKTVEEFADYGASALASTATGGLYGGSYGYSIGPSQNTQPAACFVAETLVKTLNGDIPIEEISIGDYVWAWNEDTGDVSPKQVVETYINESDELIHISVDGEEIITTPEHPFYSPAKGWTKAIHLRAGDILVLVNGEYVIVEKVQHEFLEAPILVYNFQVAENHTYYVSNSGILVHNTCSQNNVLPKNGTTMNSTDALDVAIDFLGPGYSEASPGRFVSSDGMRQVRMGAGDLMGTHAGGPHINFNILFPQYKNSHIYFFD